MSVLFTIHSAGWDCCTSYMIYTDISLNHFSNTFHSMKILNVVENCKCVILGQRKFFFLEVQNIHKHICRYSHNLVQNILKVSSLPSMPHLITS